MGIGGEDIGTVIKRCFGNPIFYEDRQGLCKGYMMVRVRVTNVPLLMLGNPIPQTLNSRPLNHVSVLGMQSPSGTPIT